MTIRRLDNVGIVVDDLDAAIAFFTELGMELEGRMPIEAPWADRVVGLDGMRARMKELGGRLTLFRRPPGTSVLASLPLVRQVREPGERSVPARS